MKRSTAIIRRMDELGRVVVPKALREYKNIQPGQPFEIFTTEKGFTLEPYYPEEEYHEKTNAEIAVEWLKERRHKMNKYSPTFTVKDRTVICEVIENNKRITNSATCSPQDDFDFNIGAIIAFCRAAGLGVLIPMEFYAE